MPDRRGTAAAPGQVPRQNAPMPEMHNTVQLLQRWRDGDAAVAQEIHDRLSPELRALALQGVGPAFQRRFDADDVLQSVFRTLFRRVRSGEIVGDQSRAIRGLLAQILRRKLAKQVRHHCAQQRSVRAEAWITPEDLSERLAYRPDEQDLLAIAEEIDRILTLFEPDEATIFRNRLEGKTSATIANELGIAKSTVDRVLRRVAAGLRSRLRDFD